MFLVLCGHILNSETRHREEYRLKLERKKRRPTRCYTMEINKEAKSIRSIYTGSLSNHTGLRSNPK